MIEKMAGRDNYNESELMVMVAILPMVKTHTMFLLLLEWKYFVTVT